MAETFDALGAPPQLLAAIAARGYETPTPVQQAVLSGEASGRDLIVSSRTGSGKTLAFGLAMAKDLLEGGAAPSKPLALVVAPTRELASQVASELAWLFAQAGARIATCVGGTEMGREIRALREGPHIVVGTPGRLVDHLERKTLNLTALKILVLDEADEMLDMGFRDELETLLKDAAPARRTMLFSATMPAAIEQLARRYQKNALRLAATPTAQAHQDIEVRAHPIATREREHAVVNTLRFSDSPSAIVFCATRDAVNHLSANLLERGFAAVALSGELTQPERNRALKALRDGRARVLVATDVAARGLDLPDVGLIIQADLPQNAEVLQHRNGRTGRAGRKGVAVLLVPSSSRRLAEGMFRKAGVKVAWSAVPLPEVIRVRDRDRLARDIEGLLREPAEEDLQLARLILRDHDAEALAAALVKLRREGLPAPEDLPLSAMVDKAKPEKVRVSARDQAHAAKRAAAHAEAPAPARGAAAATARSAPAAAARGAAAPAARSAAAPAARGAAAAAQKGPATPGQRPAATEPRPETAVGAPREKVADRRAAGEYVWYRINVGRAKKADPRWLLPLLCRRGGVAKGDIGKILILADDTRFEITAKASKRFEEAAAKPDKTDPSIKIRLEK
jgi:ATP-dependent RNA helicase DeaD